MMYKTAFLLSCLLLACLALGISISALITSEGEPPAANSASDSQWMRIEATAYCPCEKCCGDWANKPRKWFVGIPGVKIIAVDPKMIPLGSRVEIKGMGIYYAEDTGGAIKGNRIDVYFATHAEALEFGRRELEIRVTK